MNTKTLTTLQTTGQRSKLILARPIGFAKEFSAVLAVEVVNASLQRIECWSRWIVRLRRRKGVLADCCAGIEIRNDNRQGLIRAREFSLGNLSGVSSLVFNARVFQHDIVCVRFEPNYILQVAVGE